MDKNSLAGLLLIGLILFGFSYYGSKQSNEIARQKAVADSIYMVEAKKAAAQNPAPALIQAPDSLPAAQDSLAAKVAALTYGEVLSNSLNGKEQYYTIENDKLILTISSKGGAVVSAQLKDYKTYEGDPLILFKKEGAVFDMSFFTAQQINTSRFFFSTDSPEKVIVADKGSVSFKLYTDTNSYVEYVYTMKQGDYMVDFNINFVGMEGKMSPSQSDISIKWANISPQNERGFDYENQYTTVAYMFPGDSSIEEFSMSKGTEQKEVNSQIKWIAFKQQFFSSILVAKNNFANGTMEYQTMNPDTKDIKSFSANMSLPYSLQTTGYELSYYFGPNQYNTLKSYNDGFERLVPLGWGIIGWINRFIVIPTFNFLGKYIANFGIIILILTLFIKLIIFPFTYKSYLSMAKMRLLKPEMDAINAKFPKKDDAMKKQQALMDLYGKAGVSPMGGCLPMLFQLPVLIAMFRFFPASIELRGESFLWANDLSSYDSVLQLPFTIPFYGDHVSLFALLMGISLFVSSKINFAQTNAASSNQLPGMTFMTLYIMPIMLVVWFNSYSSGLSYYYLLSNLVTIGQSFIFRRLVDDKKLHQQMKDNAKKPRKKSAFQQRYQDMMKQQQSK